MPDQISPEVKRFIQNAINSVEQLEVLLFLVSNPEQAWSAEDVSARIRVAPETVAAKLAELHKAQLLAVTDEEAPRYRYAPATSALAQEVADRLNQAYKEGKDTIIQLIYSRPLDNIRYFADAFRIKKED